MLSVGGAICGGALGSIPNPHHGLMMGVHHHQVGDTIVTMKLGGDLRQEIEQEKDIQCRVGPNSKITVEVTGQQKTLDVPFTGKINKVFKNGMTAEEDVDGTYTYSTVTNIVPAVIKEEQLD